MKLIKMINNCPFVVMYSYCRRMAPEFVNRWHTRKASSRVYRIRLSGIMHISRGSGAFVEMSDVVLPVRGRGRMRRQLGCLAAVVTAGHGIVGIRSAVANDEKRGRGTVVRLRLARERGHDHDERGWFTGGSVLNCCEDD